MKPYQCIELYRWIMYVKMKVWQMFYIVFSIIIIFHEVGLIMYHIITIELYFII